MIHFLLGTIFGLTVGLIISVASIIYAVYKMEHTDIGRNKQW